MFVSSFYHHHGVKYACISPGARNSPLIYAFTKSKITCYSHIDERSSAFFALGLAKSTRSPVVIISTSGTATANFYPAVIEASLSRVPIMILTADRPEALVGTGANQTINQQNLYGNYVRYFKDVGLPEDCVDSLEGILYQSFQHVMGIKLQLPPGPVHLNFPFSEPIIGENNIKNINFSNFSNFSFKSFSNNVPIQSTIPALPKSAKPLIVVGPMEGSFHQEEIIRLGEKIQAPIFADPLSQIRYGYNHPHMLALYDHFLKIIDIKPDLIIRFGRKPTSKYLCQLLDSCKMKTYLIDDWNKFNDDCPNFIQSSIKIFCQDQIKMIDWEGKLEWKEYFLSIEKKIDLIIQSESYSEASIARVCHKSLEDGDQFIIGNSMPIRDVDMFTSNTDKNIRTFGNRGASGIDGVTSTALGISASNSNLRSLLLIGDLSLYHDMNGLLASQYKTNLTIVVINNQGGGIFSFLSIANMDIETFEKYWTTDTGLDFEKVSELYNCTYYKVNDLKNLQCSIQDSFQKEGVKIIEARTNIKDNIEAHRSIEKEVQKVLTSNQF